MRLDGCLHDVVRPLKAWLLEVFGGEAVNVKAWSLEIKATSFDTARVVFAIQGATLVEKPAKGVNKSS